MEHLNNTLAKILILNTGKFKQWKFRIQQYLQHEHYALWEVIEFKDSYVVPTNDTAIVSASERTAIKKGRTFALTIEDMQKRRNDVKARTTLLLALPDEHQLRFNEEELVKAAVWQLQGRKERDTRADFNRLQAIVSQLEFMDVETEQDDLILNLLTSLSREWLMHTIVWRNRSDLDTISLDDLYNHLKVYEPKVQKKLDSQNMAFISSSKNSSGNEEDNTAGVPTASTQVSTAGAIVAPASINLDTACAYIASQFNGSQIKYKDINQINKDDIKEMDIKWNMALLSMRPDRYWKKTRKKISIQGTDVAGFDKSKAPKALMAIDGVGWDWSFRENEEENHALVANEEAPTKFSLMAKTSADSEVEGRLVEFKNQEIKFCKKIRVPEFNIEGKTNRIEYLTKELENLKNEKEGLESKLIGFKSGTKDLDHLIGSQRFDKLKKGLGYNDVPPLPAQVYSPLKKDISWTGLPEFADDTITGYTKPFPSVESNPNDLQNSSSSAFENGESTGGILSKPEIKFVRPADTPTVVKTNKVETGKKPTVKYAEQYRKPSKTSNVKGNQRNWNNLKSQQLGENFVMKNRACFNYGHFDYLSYDCSLGVKRGRTCPTNTHKSTSPRPAVHKTHIPPMRHDNSQNHIDDKGYWDSGCSRHMTGNISYLTDYEPFDGGTHRQYNMYTIDLNNIVPHKDLTCLVAKASADESMLWHRRLGHLNFKTMNKLVRHNLVRGLPTKCFENDHNCSACLKGKQHKASCKTKLVNSVTKPLHTLHMDLFVPTSVSSLNHKWYCLVVTDDFSRFTWTFFLKTKDETSGILRNFITEIENLKELRVKIIRCDNGGEFRNKEMNDFCSRKGIKREFRNARTPQQNGVTERRNMNGVKDV
nr:putative ribonuclease H-like domain-containing protein [Tanacetum cinerariifolium]